VTLSAGTGTYAIWLRTSVNIDLNSESDSCQPLAQVRPGQFEQLATVSSQAPRDRRAVQPVHAADAGDVESVHAKHRRRAASMVPGC